MRLMLHTLSMQRMKFIVLCCPFYEGSVMLKTILVNYCRDFNTLKVCLKLMLSVRGSGLRSTKKHYCQSKAFLALIVNIATEAHN